MIFSAVGLDYSVRICLNLTLIFKKTLSWTSGPEDTWNKSETSILIMNLNNILYFFLICKTFDFYVSHFWFFYVDSQCGEITNEFFEIDPFFFRTKNHLTDHFTLFFANKTRLKYSLYCIGSYSTNRFSAKIDQLV